MATKRWTPILAAVGFVLAALFLLNHGRAGAPAATPFPLTPSTGHARRQARRVAGGSGDDVKRVEAQMAAMIRGFDRGLIHPKTLASITCTRTATNPPRLRFDPGERFNCAATYTSGERQGWCASYDGTLLGYYEGRRMCEGAADPMVRP